MHASVSWRKYSESALYQCHDGAGMELFQPHVPLLQREDNC